MSASKQKKSAVPVVNPFLQSGNSPPRLKKIRKELVKHGASSAHAAFYCFLLRVFVIASKNWDGVVSPHHALPVNCGWWKKFSKKTWNLFPVAWPFHVMLHAYLVFLFPRRASFRRALVVTVAQHRCDEKKYRLKSQVIEWYARRKTPAWIAHQIGLKNGGTIYDWLMGWGIPLRAQGESQTNIKKITHKKQIVNWYNAGRSPKWIGQRMGVNLTTIFHWLLDWGVTIRQATGRYSPKKARYKARIIGWYHRDRKSLAWIEYRIGVGQWTLSAWLTEWRIPLRGSGQSFSHPKKARYEKRIRAWYKAGKHTTWIGRKIGVTDGSINRWLREWKVPIRPRGGKPVNPKKSRWKNHILAWRKAGKPATWIAPKVGAPVASIREWLREWGIQSRHWKPVSPKKARYKLRIIAWRKSGKACDWIGNRVGVKGGAISSWLDEWKVPRRTAYETLLKNGNGICGLTPKQRQVAGHNGGSAPRATAESKKAA
jgi:hypothetical protein